MKDPELARGPAFISDLGRSNREERSDGSRHRSYLNVSRIIVGILGTAIVAIYAVGSRRLVATDTQR